MSEPQITGWEIEYRTVKGRFRFCRNKTKYCGVFIYMGLHLSVEEAGYDNFIAKCKKTIDDILD